MKLRILQKLVKFIVVYATNYLQINLNEKKQRQATKCLDSNVKRRKYDFARETDVYNWHLFSNKIDFYSSKATKIEAKDQGFTNSFCSYKQLATNYLNASLIGKFRLFLNIYFLFKYGILCALDTKLFNDYNYIDCILLGRFLVNGRSIDFSRQFMLLIIIVNTVWQILMQSSIKKYYTNAFKLMVTDIEDLIVNEEIFNGEDGLDDILNSFDKRKNFIKLNDNDKIERRMQQINRVKSLSNNNKDIVHIDVRSTGRKQSNKKISEAWFFIAEKLTLYAIVPLVGILISGLLITPIQINITITKLGFALSQEHCIEWIVLAYKQSQTLGYDSLNSLQKYSLNFIFKPKSTNFTLTNEMKTIWVENEDFIEFNLYHSIRIISSLLDTLMFGFEAISFIISILFLIMVDVHHVQFYTSFIERRLEILELVLQEIDLSNFISSSYLALEQLHYAKNNSYSSSKYNQIELYTKQLQWMIIDLFRTIKSSNVLISHFITMCLYMWLGFSVLATSWMFQNTIEISNSPKLECYLAHAIATLIMCLIIDAISKVRRGSFHIYKLSASCMALTSEHVNSKNRWIYIMRFYYPRSLNCFTLFQNVQMSWFSAMKLVAWLFSALFIISTFYTYY